MRVADEGVDAGVLESDGVEHAAVDLAGSGHGVSVGGEGRDALDGDAAKAVEGYEALVFAAVSEGSGGGQDGIAQAHSAEVHCRFSHGCDGPVMGLGWVFLSVRSVGWLRVSR